MMSDLHSAAQNERVSRLHPLAAVQMTGEDVNIIAGLREAGKFAWGNGVKDSRAYLDGFATLLRMPKNRERMLVLAWGKLDAVQLSEIGLIASVREGDLLRINSLGVFEVISIAVDITSAGREQNYEVRDLRTNETKFWVEGPVNHMWKRGMLQIIRKPLDEAYWMEMAVQGAMGTQGLLYTDKNCTHWNYLRAGQAMRDELSGNEH